MSAVDVKTTEIRQAYEQGRQDGRGESWEFILLLLFLIAVFLLGLSLQ